MKSIKRKRSRDSYILNYKVPRIGRHPLLLKVSGAGGAHANREDMYLYLNPRVSNVASSTLVFAILSDLATRTGNGSCLMTLLDLPVYRERVCRRISKRPDSASLGGPEYLRARRSLWRDVPREHRLRAGGVRWTMPNWKEGNRSPWEPLNEAILFRLVEEWKRELRFFRAKGIDPMIELEDMKVT